PPTRRGCRWRLSARSGTWIPPRIGAVTSRCARRERAGRSDRVRAARNGLNELLETAPVGHVHLGELDAAGQQAPARIEARVTDRRLGVDLEELRHIQRAVLERVAFLIRAELETFELRAAASGRDVDDVAGERLHVLAARKQ